MGHQDDERPSLRQRWRELGSDQVREELQRRRESIKERPKVTAEDMERMWEQRTEQWSSRMARTSINPGKVLRLTAAVAALLGVALVGASTDAAISEDRRAQVEHQEQMEELDHQVVTLEQKQETSVASLKTTLEGYLAQARQAGEEVAGLQNEFAEILVKANTQERLEGLGPYPAEVDAAEHRRTLRAYWAEASLIVDSDAVAYGVNRFDAFSSFEIDPRYPWYTKMKEPHSATYADPQSYQWHMAAAMPGTGASPERIQVTWLNHDDQGWLLAWATATYDAELKVFSDLQLGRSSTGVKYQHWGAAHDYDDSFSDAEYVDEENYTPVNQDDDDEEVAS